MPQTLTLIGTASKVHPREDEVQVASQLSLTALKACGCIKDMLRIPIDNCGSGIAWRSADSGAIGGCLTVGERQSWGEAVEEDGELAEGQLSRFTLVDSSARRFVFPWWRGWAAEKLRRVGNRGWLLGQRECS